MVLPLSALSGRDADVAGSKAAALGAVLRAGLPVPPGFVVLPSDRDGASWTAAAAALGGLVAVRSTAASEDGPVRSQAGAYVSVVGVAPGGVPAAVARVRRSMPEGSAVLVQRAVDAVAAGVLFTVHPVSGSWREMLVEAVHGLGGALVSGQVRSSAWVLRRPSRVPRRMHAAWGRIRVEVLSRHVVAQDVRLDVRGRKRRNDDPGPPLDDDALRKLGLLGLRLEAVLGGPLDVEWCRDGDGALWVVQARPVTSAGASVRGRDVLWTRRFLGERFPDPVTPLGWDTVEPVLNELVGFPDLQERLGGGGAFRLYAGRPYVNATVFRHLAMKAPGLALPRFLAELLPVDEVRSWNASFAVPPDASFLAAAARTVVRERRWARFAIDPFRHHAAWRTLEGRIRDEVAAAGPTADPRGRVVRWQALLADYLGVHLVSLVFGHVALEALDAALAAWAPDRPWREALATEPEGNRTLAVVADLVALAEAGPFDPAGPATAAFLARHGHRAHVSWDPGTPRWREVPEVLAGLVAAQGGARPAPKADRVAVVEALAEVGFTRAAALRALSSQVRRFVLLRENQRYALDSVLAAIRVDLLAVGADLVAAGRLDASGDVVWLRWAEVDGAGDLRDVVRLRRAEDAAARELTAPAFLRGDVPVRAAAPDGVRWTGTAIAPGVASGPARRVRSLADGARVRPGDVLVAPAFDPSWAPLLSSASAAVWELGSVLSHGAVVAREMGRPVVANLDGIVDAVEDGVELTVDGGRGVVWVR